jgi:hypothetical protein
MDYIDLKKDLSDIYSVDFYDRNKQVQAFFSIELVFIPRCK